MSHRKAENHNPLLRTLALEVFQAGHFAMLASMREYATYTERIFKDQSILTTAACPVVLLLQHEPALTDLELHRLIEVEDRKELRQSLFIEIERLMRSINPHVDGKSLPNEAPVKLPDCLGIHALAVSVQVKAIYEAYQTGRTHALQYSPN